MEIKLRPHPDAVRSANLQGRRKPAANLTNLRDWRPLTV